MPRIKVRTTKKTVIRYKRKKTGLARCARCGAVLHGISRATSNERGKLSFSEKRSERPFGGHYCTKCSRQIFREKVWNLR